MTPTTSPAAARAASPSSRRAWIEISPAMDSFTSHPVALLAEGVDRNCLTPMVGVRLWSSPSSRRAWIEMDLHPVRRRPHQVALLAEGVDRNSGRRCALRSVLASPSSRRAWIEIPLCRR